ncbi:MAG: hypothetical protein KAT68_17095 [Bacteroidales bacterium]|nr:hypothetical protein [Bacteroidales bacterium]
MNNNKQIIVVIFTLILISGTSLTSTSHDCNNFSQSNCVLPVDWPYEFNSQSVNITLIPGQSYKFSAVFYENYDYYIGFCTEEGGGNLQYRLLSTDVYLDEKYDPISNTGIPNIEFINTNTRIVIIEVKILRSSATIDVNNKQCVGIIIGSKKTDDNF